MMVEVVMVGMEKAESIGTIWNWNIGMTLFITNIISNIFQSENFHV